MLINRDKNQPPADANGISAFIELTKYYRSMVAWALAGSIAPIVAGIVNLAPPWPPAIVPVTSLFELVALIVVFQFLSRADRKLINVVIIGCLLSIVIFLIVYLFLLSQFTYEEPLKRIRSVKGFVCTAEAKLVFIDKCPFYGDDELRKGEWEAARFWTMQSITIMRLSLVLVWLLVFTSFSGVIGSFIAFQMRRNVNN
jgi:hypothetical protein